ncbi:class I adenylate-forming enzyme family protein [Magnetofaba australis]|uniref:Putative long-chain-fatty-acid--CoA ligase n=1 Tax=Magnetofaba australis IT-1 TaxID=1434232 RepID=A0A1Y2K3J2_9PROT|nr:class I adenylate-forming enzyme family protein [Magnetofaba australis]OSM02509.1 putative long-chain-fatty-acid--CoA ligase [Magnetofaba australis IT-1]
MSRWLQEITRSLSGSPHGVTEVEGGRTISHPDLLARADIWNRAMSGLSGQVVSVVLPNGIEWIAAYIACLRNGAVFNPIPYFSSVGELARIFTYVQPGLLITDREDLITRYIGEMSALTPDQVAALEPIACTAEEPDDDAIACLYYSSGTTGNPKGVLYSHGNVFALIDSINRGFRFDAETRQLAFLPFGHTASINYNILPALLAGSPLFTSQGFEKLRANFFQVLAENRINYTEVVPSVLLMLLKLKHDLTGLDLSALRFIGCGSSTLPLESQRDFMQTYGVKVANLYGLSETGPSHVDDPTVDGWEPGSIGVALDCNQCRIAEDGEILLKGPNVFVGYYKNEALYNEVVVDGWFHTGDLGREEPGGVFVFTDRKKDLIIKSGINIVPAEIEEVIYGCDAVLGCVAVGKQDPVHGEVIAVAVAPKDPSVDRDELIKAVRAICREKLSTHKLPSVIEVVDEIPKTHSGKLQRRKIRDHFAR